MPSTECSDLDSGNPNLVFKLSKSQYSDTTTYCKIQLIAKSNLLQNPTYFTLLEVIYLLSKVQIKYQDASIIVLAVDVLDQSLCVAEHPYTKLALSSLSFQNSMKYGMKEEQLISYTAGHTACVDFFTNELNQDRKKTRILQ